MEGQGCGGTSAGVAALCSWEWTAGSLTKKGQSLDRLSDGAELLRAEISRVRIGGFSSSRTGVFSCSGIGGILWKAGGGVVLLRDWWLFSPLFPASGPWIKVGSPSQPQLALAEAPSLRRLEWSCGHRGQLLLRWERKCSCDSCRVRCRVCLGFGFGFSRQGFFE